MSQIPSPKLHNGRFTEETLREQVHAVWGAYGAHADILDRLISLALPAGYVLVERALVEEAADGLDPSCSNMRLLALASRLRATLEPKP